MISIVLFFTVAAVSPVVHPVFPPDYKPGSVKTLKGQVAPALKFSVKELYDMAPACSGFYFCGCPNCGGGSQEGAMSWEPAMGDTVKCRFCGMVFPNSKFPANHEVVITAPSGARQVYRYYQDKKGAQYFFEARAWFARCDWLQRVALKMANLYVLTGDADYADRAAAIVGRFAQVYPDYAVRFDYPFQPKRFFPANQKWPYDGIGEFRGAKFYWWAYGDIPADLAKAYDLLASSDVFDRTKDLLGPEIRGKIENDLIRMGYEFTAANPDYYTNMSPGMYHDMIVAGRVIGAPEMVHDAVKRCQTLVKQKFFFDGWWCEGTPSYHQQTINNLQRVVNVAQGYTDPPSWSGEKFKDLDLANEIPLLAKAFEVNQQACLPDGRAIPINDTWWTDSRRPTKTAASRLWSGMGHAMLGAGEGETQFQLHLNWSGGFGHSHADNGSIILYAFGKELLSDIGYTHTRYRNWTVNSASHNLVVVDAKSQALGKIGDSTEGSPLFYDADNAHVRIMAVDARTSYPQSGPAFPTPQSGPVFPTPAPRATSSVAGNTGLLVYQRRLICVHAGEGKDYVVDVFDVEGGTRHDYFLHGSADEQGAFETSVPVNQDVATLAPNGAGKQEPADENCLDMVGDKYHAYWFLWQVKSALVPAPFQATWRYGDVGLRTHLFPEPETTLYTFVSPAIRGAKDEDAKLHDFLRRGLVLRHAAGAPAPACKSRFVAVHEPFTDAPWITDAHFTNGLVTVTYGTTKDTVSLDNNRVVVTSSAGWAYDSGAPITGVIRSLERGDSFVLEADRDLPPIRYINLLFGGQRRVIYPVLRIEKNRVILSDDPGFKYEPGSNAENSVAEFLYFPQETFKGPITFTAFVPDVKN